MADQHADVINWDEAMQQVGEDEDFLRELLNDLRSELESQLNAVTAIIQVRGAIGRNEITTKLNFNDTMIRNISFCVTFIPESDRPALRANPAGRSSRQGRRGQSDVRPTLQGVAAVGTGGGHG
jgi:hypothetical protein